MKTIVAILKRSPLAILAAFLLVSSCGGPPKPGATPQPLDLKNGFKELKWGADLRELGPAFPVGPIDEPRMYKKSIDSFQIGAVTLPYVYYGFCQGRFCAVALPVPEAGMGLGLRQELTRMYGPAGDFVQLPEIGSILTWDLGQVEITLNYAENGYLKLRYKPLVDKTVR